MTEALREILAARSKPKKAAYCRACPVTGVDLQLTVSTPDTAQVSALPSADFLIVVWTEAEANALAKVLGKGVRRLTTSSSNNFTPLLYPGMTLPIDEPVHGLFFQATIAGKSVICLKSQFHPKFQTAATSAFFQKMVGPAGGYHFSYLITSGTSGGIWASLDVGDVVVTNTARYGLTMPLEKQALQFTGVADVVGGAAANGHPNWYEYVTAETINGDACVNGQLVQTGGRNSASGISKIYYAAAAGELTDGVTNSMISDDELGKIATYRTLGATLDENDAYVAEALDVVGFSNWVSIRNVSDLPGAPDDQYDQFGLCSSIYGAYAAWAFVMGH